MLYIIQVRGSHTELAERRCRVKPRNARAALERMASRSRLAPVGVPLLSLPANASLVAVAVALINGQAWIAVKSKPVSALTGAVVCAAVKDPRALAKLSIADMQQKRRGRRRHASNRPGSGVARRKPARAPSHPISPTPDGQRCECRSRACLSAAWWL